MVCVGEVLPLLHKKATGATPPVEAAVQVMFDVVGAPEQETENVSALAMPADASKREATMLLAANNFIFMRIMYLT